jgi:hypothetical protein
MSGDLTLSGNVSDDSFMLYVGDADLEEVVLDFARFAEPIVIRNVEFKVYVEDGKLCLVHESQSSWTQYWHAMNEARSRLLESAQELKMLEVELNSMLEEVMSGFLTDNQVRGIGLSITDKLVQISSMKRNVTRCENEIARLGDEPPRFEISTFRVPQCEPVLLQLPTNETCPVVFLRNTSRKTLVPTKTFSCSNEPLSFN